MDTKDEIEYLKNIPKDWWKTHTITVTVATLLDRYGYFSDKRSVIRFFEKPWHYQSLVDELIKDFE